MVLLYRNAAIVMTAAMMTLVSMYARAQTSGQTGTTFPKVTATMSKDYARPHVGVFGGIVNPEQSFDTTYDYGLDIGFQPWTPIGVGLEFTGLSSNRTQGTQPQDLNRTNILAKATYNLGGTIPVIRHSYLGLGLGAVIDASAYKGTHSGIAPLLGFDIPLTDEPSKYFSLGMVAKYIFVSGPAPDSTSLNGMVKYWF